MFSFKPHFASGGTFPSLLLRCLATILCSALLIAAFYSPLSAAISIWDRHEEYSYAYLVPPIVFLFSWRLLTEKPLFFCTSWLGSLFIITGGILLEFSNLSAFSTLGQYGFLISFFGVLIGMWGASTVRIILPALVCLLFAVPLPQLINAELSQNLQLISSSLGTALLRAMNIVVFQDGNIIDLGLYKLQVAEACNGLRYLFPLLSFGYLFSFALEDRPWKRIILIFSTIPVTIGMNALRIAITGIAVTIGGKEMAEGFIHAFVGYVVFTICLAILSVEVFLLIRIKPMGRFRFNYFSLPPLDFDVKEIGGNYRTIISLVILTALMALAASKGSLQQNEFYVPPHHPLVGFPLELGNWHGEQENLPSDVLDTLRPSDYFIATYRAQVAPSPVNFYIAWYDKQTADAQTHSPSLCISGSGWDIQDKKTVEVLISGSGKLEVTRLLMKQNGIRFITYYWFNERGRTMPETTYAKMYLLLDSLTMHRTDGALLRLVTPLAPSEDESNGDERLRGFLALAYPQTKLYIPGK